MANLSLGNIAQQHRPKKRRLKRLFAFSLFDWQLSAGEESCATNSAREVLHRQTEKMLLKKISCFGGLRESSLFNRHHTVTTTQDPPLSSTY